MFEYIWPLFLLAIGAYLRWYVKSLFVDYFGSYNKEKGKNIAVKEDIAEITQLVEQVKSDFSANTELLKANLHLISNVQLGMAGEERNAIIDYNLKYFTWLHLLSDGALKCSNIWDPKEVVKAQLNLDASYNNLVDSSAILSLWIDDEELTTQANDLLLKTFDALYSPATEFILEIRLKSLAISSLEQNEPMKPQQLTTHTSLSNDISSLRSGYSQVIRDNYHDVKKDANRFQTSCRQYLRRREQNM